VLSRVALVRSEPVEVVVNGKLAGETREVARKSNICPPAASLRGLEEFHSPKVRSYDPELISAYFLPRSFWAPGAPDV
jgi:hypothetical protein